MTMLDAQRSKPAETTTVTGVQLMQGLGVQPAKGFWEDAWSQVVRQPRAIASLCWIGLVGFLAAFAPLIASGHPIYSKWNEEGPNRVASPLLRYLTAGDAMIVVIALLGGLLLLVPRSVMKMKRGHRLGLILAASAQAAFAIGIISIVQWYIGRREIPADIRQATLQPWFRPTMAAAAAVVAMAILLIVPTFRRLGGRLVFGGIVAALCFATIWGTWGRPVLETFPYRDQEAQGIAEHTYTLIPFSPNERATNLRLLEPGQTRLTPDIRYAESQGQDTSALLAKAEESPEYILGTDAIGQDVMSQMIHACRLSISIGLVSTGIAVVIGVTIGALMGYFGGWVDLLLFRVVEVFMAIPVLFLLIVAAAVLPRNTYVLMIIIGCVAWTGAARFTRAEFMRLRNQDFVQAAKSVGLPLRSVLFKHMLPNGVTPVLVDSSFAIAAAILAESVLSYLGLGPAEQASWGRLLASATNEVGEFKWWLATYPGAAIFLTALAYNLLGESLRDAIDPKLKKARV